MQRTIKIIPAKTGIKYEKTDANPEKNNIAKLSAQVTPATATRSAIFTYITSDLKYKIPQTDCFVKICELIVNYTKMSNIFLYFFNISIYNYYAQSYKNNFSEVLDLKKSAVIILSIILAISGVFAACSSKKEEEKAENTTAGLFAEEEIIDEDNSNAANEPDPEDISKNAVPTKKEIKITSFTTNPENTEGNSGETTSPELTTDKGNNVVPPTSDEGIKVEFSKDDQNKICSLLNIPNIYKYNYESTNGIPTELAPHVAVSILHRSSTEATFPSGTVVLELFKYFGQTVVDFKANCNQAAANSGAPISYIKANDVFSSPAVEEDTHIVTFKEAYQLDGNNYYKIVGTVKPIAKNCKVKTVIAIVQKNKLDANYGFSIKGLKWI